MQRDYFLTNHDEKNLHLQFTAFIQVIFTI